MKVKKSFMKIKKDRIKLSFLVEVRRVELLSENTSRGTSPCADDYLHSLNHT